MFVLEYNRGMMRLIYWNICYVRTKFFSPGTAQQNSWVCFAGSALQIVSPHNLTRTNLIYILSNYGT
jgi:hypothetical protein